MPGGSLLAAHGLSRRGLFTIGEEDFRRIARAMGVVLPEG
jgi:hypothetical protein